MYPLLLIALFPLTVARDPTPDEIRAIRVANQVNTRRLYRDLIKGYDKFLSPLPPQTGHFSRFNDDESDRNPLFSLRVDQIILVNVYESSGIFSVIMAVVFNYVDERLSWQRHRYDNISQIFMRWDALWIPPLSPISCESFSRPQFDDMTHAEISFDGTVEMNLVWQLSCNCTIQGTYYPFDTQHCYNYFTFLDGSSARDRVVTLTVTGEPISNDVWYTSNITVGEDSWTTADGQEETTYFFSISLRRSSTYYLIFTILPTILQSIVGVVGMFSSGRPSKEDIPIRITLGIGALTSIIFILSSMTESIPKKDVPVLALFVIIEMLIIVVGIFYLALDPSRIFLLCVPERERGHTRSGNRWRPKGNGSTRARVLLFLHHHLHTLFLLLLLAASASNFGLNVIRYYSSE